MREVTESYKESLARLEEVLALEKSAVHRDAAIKRFEMTAELAWKALQKHLRDEGIECRSPKGCLSEAYQQGVLADDSRWFEIFETRNLTVHTYNEAFAEEVYARLPSFLDPLRALASAL